MNEPDIIPATIARRGDLAVIQADRGGWVRVGIVTSASREGLARRVRWADEASDAPETALTFTRRTLIAPAKHTHMAAALAAVRNHGTFASLAEVAELLSPFRIGA